jgi:integrase
LPECRRRRRPGEACGLHWADVDLPGRSLTVRWQITQHGWATRLEAPKTDTSEAVVALDTATVAALTADRARQDVQPAEPVAPSLISTSLSSQDGAEPRPTPASAPADTQTPTATDARPSEPEQPATTVMTTLDGD